MYDAATREFDVFAPLTLMKGGRTADEPRRLEGLASDEKRDLQGESVVQDSLDISYLKRRGCVLWNHKDDPGSIIGACAEAEIKPEGLWVAGDLFPASAGIEKANDAWKLAQAFKSLPGSRRLGWSIHGAIEKRDPDHPGKIIRAVVYHLALTHEPVNPRSYALPALAKALSAAQGGDEEPLERTLTAGSNPAHAALALENLSGQITSTLWGDCTRPDKCYDARLLYKGGWRGMLEHLQVCKGLGRTDAENFVTLLRANFGGLATLH